MGLAPPPPPPPHMVTSHPVACKRSKRRAARIVWACRIRGFASSGEVAGMMVAMDAAAALSVSLYVETKRHAWPASALTLLLFLHISPRVG